MWGQPVELAGKYVLLKPLSVVHCDGLVASVQDGDLWKLWYTLIPHPEKIKQEIERRLALQQQGTMLPFTIFKKESGRIVGATTLMHMDAANKRVEIGSTWLSQSAQKTGINTEAKLLLLSHAFENMQCNAVEFRTHFFNQGSRKSIERLGAKLDGVLRHHMVMPDGTLRDTCVYSIIHSEWLTVKKHLMSHVGCA